MSAVWGRAAQAAVEPASLRWLPAPSFVSVLAPKSGSFSLPPARAEGEGTRPPAARGVFGGAFYSAHARSLPVPQVATERAAGGDARLLSVNYNPLLGGLSLRCRSAFSGKKKKRRVTVPIEIGAVSAPLGHVSRVSSVVGNCRTRWIVHHRCGSFSGNCRTGFERQSFLPRQIPEIAEASRTGFHSCFGFFRRLSKWISSTTTAPSAHSGDGHY